ncbi:c-type cytochrome [Acidovorax sp. SUPP3334]|uniref:c-type cytochrome n=1 Tax=Acidovorax sp. SUPP3334 TaxID=2920881 RepID=UPI0023DE54F5|nr:c-type cytochrome [Acidovorax sp. SUPP3334]GKT21992.1 c-type cytochrome [Acidovorax sp. SUPP3334]
MKRAGSLALFLGLSVFSFCARAFDVAPHRIGDTLSTTQARALLERYAARPPQPWAEPDERRIPAGPEGDAIRDGIDLLRNTSSRVGKLTPDATKRLSWNSLNCVQCHQTGASGLPGTKPFALPLVNAVNDYPKFDAKSGKIISLEQRIIGMFGPGSVPITLDTAELKSIVAYLRWLARDTPAHSAMERTGLLPMPSIARAADPLRGATLYAAQCSACHGKDATGQQRSDFKTGGGYLFPPIAGSDTYDNAGHMFAVPLLARYIRASMPLGATYDRPQLTPAQALDIAAFLNDDAMPRLQNPNRGRLYPDPALRPQGFAIPEHFPGQPEAYLRAKLGPFKDVNENY